MTDAKLEEKLKYLPGAETILKGLRDIRNDRRTIESTLVSIASRRLVKAGLMNNTHDGEEWAELTLYSLLQSEPGDAYSRYNALLRELVSFNRAFDQRSGGFNKKDDISRRDHGGSQSVEIGKLKDLSDSQRTPREECLNDAPNG